MLIRGKIKLLKEKSTAKKGEKAEQACCHVWKSWETNRLGSYFIFKSIILIFVVDSDLQSGKVLSKNSAICSTKKWTKKTWANEKSPKRKDVLVKWQKNDKAELLSLQNEKVNWAQTSKTYCKPYKVISNVIHVFRQQRDTGRRTSRLSINSGPPIIPQNNEKDPPNDNLNALFGKIHKNRAKKGL